MSKPPPRMPPPPPAATGPTDPTGENRIVVPLHSAQSIVGLQICGTGRFLPLPAKNVMRLGRGDVDIPIPDDVVDRDLITREHIQITRQGTENGTWLHVVDLGSRYGTFFGKGREREFFVKAGQRFRVANTELMVMDRLLVDLRRELGGFFGYGAHDVLDENTPMLGSDVPVLLIGDRGTERGHLARAVHHNSQRRGNGFEEVKAPTASREELLSTFKKADRGAVYVSLDQIGPRAGLSRLVELMFDGTYDVRPIIAARDHRVVCDALSTVMPRFVSVTVPPVGTHREDVPAILDAMLHERGSPHRVAALGADRRAALCNYEWPRNRTELRDTAERIAALLAHDGNMAAAAASIKQNYEWFRRSLGKVGAIEVKRRGE
ncbi:MAG: FHA domain-containing protein [Kofleriaceae bacterium]|nr:FHA domain-containing protein [Kofleriaceae bacterium]